jgi:hypothetical protein
VCLFFLHQYWVPVQVATPVSTMHDPEDLIFRRHDKTTPLYFIKRLKNSDALFDRCATVQVEYTRDEELHFSYIPFRKVNSLK